MFILQGFKLKNLYIMQPKFYCFACMSRFSVSVMGNKFNFIF